MVCNNIRRTIQILSLLFVFVVAHAQYTVSGGEGVPLRAFYNEPNRVEVYLVNGMSNVSISASPTSASARWFSYTSKAIDAQPIESQQSGGVSTIRPTTSDCGYFLQEDGQMTRYVWIIDYSRYAFTVDHISVDGNCDGFWLQGSPQPLAMHYSLPATGQQVELKREFEVSFQTLIWKDEQKGFFPLSVSRIISGNPYSERINSNDTLPLCNTEVTLRGDLFARHFGMEKTITSDTYRAVAVELHTDTTLMMTQADNMTASEGTLSAPVEIDFSAIANDPVAALYVWKIYNKETVDGAENPIVRFTGDRVNYTFNEAGTFVAEVSVSDQTGTCEASASYEISITDSFLDVPNAFSPGTTPGINDEFRVAYKSIVNYKIWIFNRWGNELYHSTNPAEGWNGKKGNNYVPPGVYFYVIEAKGSDGRKYNKKGSINILRPKTIDDQIVE